ncbi:MAG: cation-translocating P-type ATPase [Nanoarchaeota archaeon]
MEWHARSIDNVLKELKTRKEGLTKEEVAFRLTKYGLNEIKEKDGISKIKIFLSQFRSPLVWILIAALIISMIAKESTDAIVIGVVLLLNSILGFAQEYKAEEAIASLKKLEADKAEVIRNNEKRMIDAKMLVPGDIIVIDEGDKIPADCRILESYNLATIEAPLTGESRTVEKDAAAVKESSIVAERFSMLYKGTMAVRGRAIAVVAETGMNTRFGKIAEMLQDVEQKKIPLNTQLEKLGKWIGIAVLFLCAVVFVATYLKGGNLWETALFSIALAVAAVPEGLPAIATISFALGVQKMAKKHALIRKLPSVETLGSTTVICTDKTGTLTMNEMTVRKIYCSKQVIDVEGAGYSSEGSFSSKPYGIDMLLKAGILCNNAALQGQTAIGDPTEASLVVSAMKSGLKREDAEKDFPRINEIPFSSERKMMTTLHKDGKSTTAFSKGSPDTILQKCTKIFYNGRIRPITRIEKNEIMKINESFAKDALRVLAFAFKPVTRKETCEKEMIFLGLQAMIDPPRMEAKDSLLKCEEAGIRVVMITGDQLFTAEAIAREIGITGKAVSGEELEKMNEKELLSAVKEVNIYARVSPEHKLRIINALKKAGNVVAMTGDGINDAPALKTADIGIAVGSGTDVAKEASDMILVDDNFATIVGAVEEGRTIYDNIRKFSAFLLSCNLAEVLIVFIAIMMGMPLPFIAIQILWINLVTDSFPALAMGVDSAGKDIMKKKPRSPKEHIVSRSVGASIISLAVIVSAICLFVYSRFESKTLIFTLLVTLELLVPYIIRIGYRTYSINKWLLGACILSFALQLAVVYTPLSKVFDTVMLGLQDWIVIGISCIMLLVTGIAAEFLIRHSKEKARA